MYLKKRIICCILFILPVVMIAQIKPGIYRVDYRYKGEVKWTIGEGSIEIINDDATLEYLRLSEDADCLIYASISNWQFKKNLLYYENLKEKFRDTCEDEFEFDSPVENIEKYEIIVSRENYFIGHSQDDKTLYMRWVSLDENPIDQKILEQSKIYPAKK